MGLVMKLVESEYARTALRLGGRKTRNGHLKYGKDCSGLCAQRGCTGSPPSARHFSRPCGIKMWESGS